jgi:iron(III) transport system substrate-binding protein
MRAIAVVLLLALAATPRASQAQSGGELVVYCSVLNDWCLLMTQTFERQTGVKVTMTQKGSGETIAQLRAEAANPKADIFYGGVGDQHLEAASGDLTAEYKSPMLDQLHPWARKQAEDSKHRTVGIYAGALGIVWNTELLAKKKLPEPKCWADVIRPEFKNEVQMSNPSSSGTAYVALATLVQVMGEDKAFDYLKKLHANINQYTRSGPAPVRNAALGETTVGINFLHDAVAEAAGGAKLKIAAPCEGTGYEIGSMSIVKGGKNPANARKWYDWALTAEAQNLAKSAKSFQVPSNMKASAPAQMPRMEDMKLINFDHLKYSATAERKRIIARWESEVGSLPK